MNHRPKDTPRAALRPVTWERLGLLTFAVAAMLVTPAALAQDAASGGVAATPPMGWNSWNHFACKVSDAVVRQAADAIASNGMKAAGYVYVNIDDCWQGQRDASGVIHPNSKFPDMKALGDYIHGQGLKFGIYSSPGPKTCAGYAGSYQHEEQDAAQYAAWGVDYLKYDWCSAAGVYKASDMPAVYTKMHDALVKTGRPIVFARNAASNPASSAAVRPKPCGPSIQMTRTCSRGIWRNRAMPLRRPYDFMSLE